MGQKIVVHGTPIEPNGSVLAAREKVEDIGPRGRMRIPHYRVTFDLESEGGVTVRRNVQIDVPEMRGDTAHWYVRLDMESGAIKRIGLATEAHYAGGPVFWEA